MHSNEKGKWIEHGGGDGVPGDASQTTGMTAVEALPDADLLAGTRRLVCQSNRDLAALLAHLAEVEARGLHRTRACASLYSYCIYELRMSEDAAYRRVGAARLVKRFPPLLGAIERGELHLTGLLQLGPHLTEANLVEVLARAQFRTKKEIEKLVRLLSPLPDVPSRIEPLGLDRPRPRATWGNLLAGRHPVRELPPDERPDNWLPVPAFDSSSASALARSEGPAAGSSVEAESLNHAPTQIHATAESPAAAQLDAHAMIESSAAALTDQPPATARVRDSVELEFKRGDACFEHRGTETQRPGRESDWGMSTAKLTSLTHKSDLCASVPLCSKTAAPLANRRASGEAEATAESSAAAPAWIEDSTMSLSGPQRYKVQFTASEEYVALLAEAKALLAHASPDADIAEIHLRAVKMLVAELKQRKYAHSEQRVATASPSAKTQDTRTAPSAEAPPCSPRQRDTTVRSPQYDPAEPPRQRDATVRSLQRDATEPRQRDAAPSSQHQGRHVPAAVRREVFERDGQRCAYVDARGVRCRETRRLEIHHHEPFARGGPMTLDNLSLHCAAHNALAAERDFGREFAREKRESQAHFAERTLARTAYPSDSPSP